MVAVAWWPNISSGVSGPIVKLQLHDPVMCCLRQLDSNLVPISHTCVCHLSPNPWIETNSIWNKHLTSPQLVNLIIFINDILEEKTIHHYCTKKDTIKSPKIKATAWLITVVTAGRFHVAALILLWFQRVPNELYCSPQWACTALCYCYAANTL